MTKSIKWIKNLESIAQTKTSGKCPYCKSSNTDYTFIGNVGEYGYGEIWCNDCKSAYHMSRVEVTKEFSVNKEVPKDLIYR